MEIENHKEEVPFSHYREKFAALEPGEAVTRLGDIYQAGAFTVRLLGRDYRIAHPQGTVTPEPPLPVRTFLLRWLLEGRQERFRGQYLTFREMPWGELYIKPYTGRVLTRAAFTFGTRLEAFRRACEKMEAAALDKGDAGYEFEFLPGFFVRLLVWEGDEEFPPNAQVIYSDNFSALAAEDRVVAGDILISAIKANM